jgi:glycosyltransferase involved in cell wall biosynthesis
MTSSFTSSRAVMPRVHQVLATLSYGDAIGHEVLGIQRVLRGAGYSSDIFTETVDPRLASHTRSYREMVDSVGPDDLLIHHFSIGSRASRTAYALSSRMALIYHNITPAEYFVGVHQALVRKCFRGRRELTAYVGRCDLALGDSEYNRRELEALGFAPTGVLPVVPGFSHLDVEPSYLLARQFDDDWTNILFVGRVVPNKRFEDVIRFVQAYRTRYNPRTRLLLVGSYTGFETYRTQLYAFAARLRASDVHLIGQVSNEELAAFYEIADLFLCASEHEGFCVPLVEAFHMGVPVMAYAAAAVPATMAGGGILYDTRDPEEVASHMHGVLDDDALRDRVLASQDGALARLRDQDFGGTLLRFVGQALQSPRRPPHTVAFDFWQQFAQADQLKALKVNRPSAFQALPYPPEARRQGPAIKDLE